MSDLNELKEILERCEKDKAHTNGEWRGEYERCTQNRRFCDTARTDLPRVTRFALALRDELRGHSLGTAEWFDQRIDRLWQEAGKDAGQ